MTIGLGDRMKRNYEGRNQSHLIRRLPVIIRLDGKTFHTVTRGCEKPFDRKLADVMRDVTINLCSEVQGCKCAYIQSDEISLLVTDYDTLATDAWFDYNVQKMVSISAGIASVHFSSLWDKKTIFDSRAFNIPKEEVCNYFVWRQKDWIRNSMLMLGQAHFSHKQMQNKNQANIHDMLHEIDVNWADLDTLWKNGCFISRLDGKWEAQTDIIFTKDKDIIEQFLINGE